MADFKKAIGPLLRREGGYVNDQTDLGGETYKGITRRNWPDWEGWAIVDRTRIGDHVPPNETLDLLVADFYKRKYWDVLLLDQELFQRVADKVFDVAVNQGIKIAREYYVEAKRLA